METAASIQPPMLRRWFMGSGGTPALCWNANPAERFIQGLEEMPGSCGIIAPTVEREWTEVLTVRLIDADELREMFLYETCVFTPMTYRNLCAMAEVSGLKYPGQAVDKLVRSLALQARELRRKDER